MKLVNFLHLSTIVARSDWGSEKSLLARFELLRSIAKRLLPEYKFKWPQLDWWQSKDFNSYLALFGEENGNNADRRLVVSQLLRLLPSVDGDTVEVGCFEGAMSWLICKANNGLRQHHIFDSFEGLSSPDPVDGEHWLEGALSCDESKLIANLSEFSGSFKTYQGWVPERFIEVDQKRFAFVHVDVDLYEPTLKSLEFFYPRLNPGAILVCDDYGFNCCPGATRACNDFMKDKSEAMLSLPDGGGFFIKGIASSHSVWFDP